MRGCPTPVRPRATMRRIVPSLLACCAGAGLAAEEGGDPIVIEGESEGAYLVEASTSATKTTTPLLEIPQSVSVVTAEELSDQGVARFDHAFRYTPGVQGEPFGVETRNTWLRIRGFDAAQDGYFRDGLKLYNPWFVGYSPEPYGAGRVDVLKGPASVLYGQGSPGGLVDYVSKRPRQEPHHEVVGTVGNHQRFEGRFDSTAAIDPDGEFSYRITGLVRDSETQVDFVDDDRIYLAPAFTWNPSEQTTLTVLGHYHADDTSSSQRYPVAGTLEDNPHGEIPIERFTGEPDFDSYERDVFALGYLLEHRFTEELTLHSKGRYYQNETQDDTIFTTSLLADQRTVTRSAASIDGEVAGFTLDNHVEYAVETGAVEHTVLAGIDYSNVSASNQFGSVSIGSLDLFDPVYGAAVPARTTFIDKDFDLVQIGLYAQDQMVIHDDWFVTASLRYDLAETEEDNKLTDTTTEWDDSEFTWRLGVLYRSAVGLSPYASYMTSFLPSLDTDANGDPLDPETARQFELGVKYELPEELVEGLAGHLTLAYFDLTREDFSEFNAATSANEQTGEARNRGVEFEAVLHHEVGLEVQVAYTYIDSEIIESSDDTKEGARLAQVPENQFSIWGDYTIQEGPVKDLGFGLGIRYIGSKFGDAPNTLEIPSETLLDAAVHYAYEGFTFSGNVQNLTDERHVASGFNQFGTDWATFGQERTFSLSAGYRW